MSADYVWRLEIEYPDGSRYDPEHPEDRRWITFEPEGWEPLDFGPDDDVSFRWPPVRRFLSESAALRRVKRFEQYGAKARVVRSLPVQWPGGGEITEGTQT